MLNFGSKLKSRNLKLKILGPKYFNLSELFGKFLKPTLFPNENSKQVTENF